MESEGRLLLKLGIRQVGLIDEFIHCWERNVYFVTFDGQEFQGALAYDWYDGYTFTWSEDASPEGWPPFTGPQLFEIDMITSSGNDAVTLSEWIFE